MEGPHFHHKEEKSSCKHKYVQYGHSIVMITMLTSELLGPEVDLHIFLLVEIKYFRLFNECVTTWRKEIILDGFLFSDATEIFKIICIIREA